MWWLIQNILFSVCLIVIIHYLYIYFETTLTSPKVKDLIHCPKQEYKLLLESVHKKVDGKLDDIPPSQVLSLPTHADSSVQQQQKPLPSPIETLGISTNHSTDDMKVDLKEYLRELALKTNQQMN
ncbi:hypothetical protein EBU71_18405 [bacterium]|jgi:hypothetical protein|nr:hypothetical protein [Candidatus Elulimicrobium humile]